MKEDKKKKKNLSKLRVERKVNGFLDLGLEIEDSGILQKKKEKSSWAIFHVSQVRSMGRRFAGRMKTTPNFAPVSNRELGITYERSCQADSAEK